MQTLTKNKQYYKFCFYGFLKNLRFFDAFFILYLVDKGLPYTQIGLLYAVREIIVNVFEIPSGIIADTYGRKSSLVFSFLISIASFTVFYFSSNFWLFLLAFSLYGIADAFRSGTHKGMIMHYLKLNNWQNQKINYYGHTRSCSQKGSAISSLVAGVIVFYTGSISNIFLYSIFPYLINFLLILSYPKELNHSSENTKQNRGFLITFKSFFATIKQAKVLKIINTSALHSAYIKSVKDYIQPIMISFILVLPFFNDIDITKKNGLFIGVFYFIIYLITSQASRTSYFIESRQKKNIAYITLILGFSFGAISGLFYVYNMWLFSILAFVGIYIIENIRKPILTGYVADNVSNEILTSVMSAQSQLKTLITAILAFVFGLLADKFDLGIAFIIMSLFLVISSTIINYFLKK